MLLTKAIRAPIEHSDGIRISVMSRHTLQDGRTPDTTIHDDMYDVWWPELAPPTSLLGDYYKRSLSWADFESRFDKHLASSAATAALNKLIELSYYGTAAILCTEGEPKKCHRRLVAEKCKLIVPELIVVIE